MWPHELKLQRATQHFKELETQVRRWEEGEGYTLRIEPDSYPPHYVARAELLRPVEDEPFALLVGDFLHNARAALDYIAGALGDIGADGTMAEKDALGTMFPITDSPERFAKMLERRLPTVTHPVRAAIENLQPYKTGGDRWDFEPLWILNELARFDRHRFLHIGYERAGLFRLNPDTSRNVRIEHLRVEEGPFSVLEGIAIFSGEDSAVLARFDAEPINPRQEMHMDWEGALEIVFDPDRLPESIQLVEGMSILSILRGIEPDIREVFRTLAPFLPAEPPRW